MLTITFWYLCDTYVSLGLSPPFFSLHLGYPVLFISWVSAISVQYTSLHSRLEPRCCYLGGGLGRFPVLSVLYESRRGESGVKCGVKDYACLPKLYQVESIL